MKFDVFANLTDHKRHNLIICCLVALNLFKWLYDLITQEERWCDGRSGRRCMGNSEQLNFQAMHEELKKKCCKCNRCSFYIALGDVVPGSCY